MEVFLSYSHQDEDLRNELEKHLSILKRHFSIQTTVTTSKCAGRWKDTIKAKPRSFQ